MRDGGGTQHATYIFVSPRNLGEHTNENSGIIRNNVMRNIFIIFLPSLLYSFLRLQTRVKNKTFKKKLHQIDDFHEKAVCDRPNCARPSELNLFLIFFGYLLCFTKHRVSFSFVYASPKQNNEREEPASVMCVHDIRSSSDRTVNRSGDGVCARRHVMIF